MRRYRLAALVALLALAAALPAGAQESASYRLTQHSLNAGGVPAEGQVHTSASFTVSLESIAGPVGSFVAGLHPATEVTGLRFMDKTTLVWDGHPATGHFRLYRDDLSAAGGTMGHCHDPAVPVPTTTDLTAPSPGQGFLYLANVVDTLGAEGPPGSSSVGSARMLAGVCP